MLGGQLGQPREVAAAVLGSLGEGRHRHQAGHRAGAALDEVAELAGVDALLRLLARHVDLDQHLARPGSARAVAAPTRRRSSGSAARSGAMSLSLRLWSAPMKSQVNRSPWRPAWRAGPARGSRRPARCRPRPARAGPPPRRTWSPRRISTSRADPLAHALEVRRIASAVHQHAPAPPGGRSRRRRGGGRSTGPAGSSCSGRGARPRVTPAAAELRADHRGAGRACARRRRRRTSANALEHLGPDLVAAAADAGPDRGRGRRRRSSPRPSRRSRRRAGASRSAASPRAGRR